ncbi:hypothetical protein FRB96_006213 [Tulasnella sp. 330]|nr:hypothetical protein FRB96_006213 [Tulasnella sp. 330]KAG8874739.1 hypothetical protein FRB97_005679 [Tulasnella sp. 331]KAG8886274.1 hypothetical protein FRB98_001371 [Tulasnella sp. 332]
MGRPEPAESPVESQSGLENGTPSLAQPARSNFKNVLIILGCAVGQISLIASQSIISALPTIGRDLHIPQQTLQWPISAYALTSGCFLLLLGRLADVYGRRRAFILGIAWFTAWAIACAFAQTAVQLSLFRAFQGIGVAAATPAAIGILAQEFPPGRMRTIAFATFSCGAPMGGSIGILVGGTLTQLASDSWRSMFFVFAGLAVLAGLAVFFAVPRDKFDDRTDRRVDWLGAAMITVSLVMLLFALAQGEVAANGWGTPYIIVLLILSLFGIATFLCWEWYLEYRAGYPPLMRLSLWKRANGKFAAVQAIAFVVWIAFNSWIYWATLLYQSYLGLSPVRSMIRFIPMFVSGATCNFIVAMLVGRISGSILLAIGSAATGVACLLFALIQPHATFWAFGFPAATIVVLGADFTFATGSIFVAKVALPHEQSLAGGIYNTVMQIGAAIGLAVTTVIADRVTSTQSRKLGYNYDPRNPGYVPPEAQIRGYRAAQWAGFGFCMFSLLLVLVFLRDIGKVGGPHKPVEDEEITKSTAPSTLMGTSPESPSPAPPSQLDRKEA